MAARFIRISVIYFAVGVLLGMYMSMAHNYDLTGVHVHVNLLGWSSMALAGIIYHLYPAASNSSLATYHFWGMNIGLPIMMIGLALLILTKSATFTVFVSIGAIITVLSVLVFFFNVLGNVKSA